jgi:xanthine dehydrogenase accessory factor
MRDIVDQIESWLGDGQSVALATVIKTWGSSPRPAGSGMAVSAQGEIVGSVSGGCVEGAVIDAALQVLRTGQSARLHFGVADDIAWKVGLSCGGEIDIFIRQFDQSDLAIWKRALTHPGPTCLALVLVGQDSTQGADLLVDDSDSRFADLGPETSQALRVSAASSPAGGVQSVDSAEIKEAFFQQVLPEPELILVGGVHIAIPLASLAKTVGFQVTVIDPRKLFSTEQRFPDIKRLLAEWPEQAFQKIELTRSSAVVMLTHDPKIDDPALLIALNSPAFYIGALGSRKTHQNRIDRLLTAGIPSSKLDQIHAPVGLDLGGRAPAEIALGIMAEILQAWYGKETSDA